jgi:GGDEF domain-containing protein
LGQNLLETLRTSPIPISSGASVQISFSAGVAGIDEGAFYDEQNTSEAEVAVVDRLLRGADLALYRAKELGRQRVLAFAGIVS